MVLILDPRALINYEARRITSFGQRFKTQLEVSPVLTNLQANYFIPGKNPATEKYAFSAATQQEYFPVGKGNLVKIAASYVSTVNKWQRVISLTLQRETWSLQKSALSNTVNVNTQHYLATNNAKRPAASITWQPD